MEPMFPTKGSTSALRFPCSRLSRPRSTVGQSDCRQVFRSSSLCRLVRPYKPGLNLTALPCSHEILWLHAGGTNPGSISGHLPCRIQSSCLPRYGIGSATSTTIRFRGYLAVHCCSGLQPPCLRFAMAVAGHHARLGTRLRARGFAAVSISAESLAAWCLMEKYGGLA